MSPHATFPVPMRYVPSPASETASWRCLQQRFGLADEALEDATHERQSMREFMGIDLSRETCPMP